MSKDLYSRRKGVSFAGAVAATAASLAIAGCGNTYRPVVSAINPVGPAGQPTKYAVAVSSPSATLPGQLTIVDFAGDTTLATPQLVTNPSYFALNASGTSAFVVNNNTTTNTSSLNTFGVSNPSSLITSDITQATLPVGSTPVPTLAAISLLNSGGSLFVPESGRSKIAALSSGDLSLQQEISVGANPVYVVGVDGSPRAYAISQNTPGGPGQVASLEGTSLAVSATIPVGITPVYGVMTADTRRAFILNQGSGNVTVINTSTNALDTTTPTIPATGTLGIRPIWAEIVTRTTELVVLNQGNGTTPGTLSIISIPLCSQTAQASNPNCNSSNPIDAVGFGNVIATVPVGINPVMVSVLADGSRAYVANAGNATTNGSVSVVNLVTGTVTATIQSTSATITDRDQAPTLIYGHPNSISATSGSPTGKVYITSGDSRYMTVLRTDTDTVYEHINLQGNGLRVLVTAQ